MKRGKFIVIEGADGLGKTSIINMLKQDQKYKDIVFLCDPYNCDVSLRIRDILKLCTNTMDPKTNLLLHLAARAELNKIIEANLNEGKNVICDRYELSTIAYQCDNYNNKIGELYYKMKSVTNNDFNIEPDRYIILTRNKPYRMETNDTIEEVFGYNKVNLNYKKLAIHYSDSSTEIKLKDLTLEEVYNKVTNIIDKELKLRYTEKEICRFINLIESMIREEKNYIPKLLELENYLIQSNYVVNKDEYNVLIRFIPTPDREIDIRFKNKNITIVKDTALQHISSLEVKNENLLS